MPYSRHIDASDLDVSACFIRSIASPENRNYKHHQSHPSKPLHVCSFHTIPALATRPTTNSANHPASQPALSRAGKCNMFHPTNIPNPFADRQQPVLQPIMATNPTWLSFSSSSSSSLTATLTFWTIGFATVVLAQHTSSWLTRRRLLRRHAHWRARLREQARLPATRIRPLRQYQLPPYAGAEEHFMLSAAPEAEEDVPSWVYRHVEAPASRSVTPERGGARGGEGRRRGYQRSR